MRDQPPYRHVFRLTDGRTLICEPSEARRVVDKRNPWEEATAVWEILDTRMQVSERLWPSDITSWQLEELTPIKELKMDEAS